MITFQYHMYGATIGTLSVADAAGATRWSLSGNPGNSWRSASVTIDSASFQFDYVRGSSYTGDAAIGPEHFGALEDAVGRWPITRLMFGRLADGGLSISLNYQAQQTLREAADLTPAIFSLLINGDAEPIRKEGPELQSVLAELLRAIDADPAGGHDR